MNKMNNAMAKRMPIYYQGLKRLQQLKIEKVKSIELADYLNIDASTIRRDFSNLGELGKQGYGYNVDYLVEVFHDKLGLKQMKAILIGVGNLGTAILKYDFMSEFDFEIIKAYDTSDLLVGKEINGIKIEALSKSCELYDNADIAIVCVDNNHAKDVVNKLSQCRMKGILNFTNERFASSEHTAVHNVDLSGELLELLYYVQNYLEES